jgi:Sporulation and spore germination
VTKVFKAHKLKIVLGSILTLLLLVSALLYMLDSHKQLQRRFLFLTEGSRELAGEIRPVPRAGDSEGEITNFIEELLLGPARLRLADLFPPGTRLNQTSLIGRTLYIDFSRELAFNLENHPLTLVEIKRLLVDNLNRNFPRLERIVITIDGHEPRFEIQE